MPIILCSFHVYGLKYNGAVVFVCFMFLFPNHLMHMDDIWYDGLR
jgi:hypothetical protein